MTPSERSTLNPERTAIRCCNRGHFYIVDPINAFVFAVWLAHPHVSAFALTDARVLIIANNQNILPDIPNGVRVTDLPTPLTGQPPQPNPASAAGLSITEEGIEKGWEVEHMLEPEVLSLPNGEVIIVNVGERDTLASVLMPSLYRSDAPRSWKEDHLTPLGYVSPPLRTATTEANLSNGRNILISGSNPNGEVVNGTKVCNRISNGIHEPAIHQFNIDVTIPILNLKASSIKVAHMDLGFSSHTFHSSSRLVFMEA
ncbi:hypothetical protein D9613_006351 [Agrocybe pediades]|uniref:Uncharacterized protein n=1 Tax=Agrocybe pediades TaxID=84607 RepID=A0A8H4VP78_9AGAR|nr:hypothetical protein D9613_006351 [Agrocybe pediades]